MLRNWIAVAALPGRRITAIEAENGWRREVHLAGHQNAPPPPQKNAAPHRHDSPGGDASANRASAAGRETATGRRPAHPNQSSAGVRAEP